MPTSEVRTDTSATSGVAPNAGHPENVALRRAMERRLPLIWFQGIAPGLYLPIFPVWLVGEEPEQHQFVVALDLEQLHTWGEAATPSSSSCAVPTPTVSCASVSISRCSEPRCSRPTRTDVPCAVYDIASCSTPLTSVATALGGEPVVTNGIAMCKIHHAAFDNLLMAVRPDYAIEVRCDVLVEEDGPTLRYALQGLHEERIELPRQRAARPNRELLEERYELFRVAS